MKKNSTREGVLPEEGSVPSENVASEGLKSNIEFTPATKESYDGRKFHFLHDDEVGHAYTGPVPERFKKVVKSLTITQTEQSTEETFEKRTPDLCCGIYGEDILLPDLDIYPGEVATEYFDLDYTREDGK